MKVLIVDDEFYFRKALIETIDWASLHIEVCAEAENGLEALELIREKNPEIVLADINMPKMTGLEFARKVKKINGRIKIIFISGYDTFQYAKEAISLGADDYLLKPLKEQELYETLSNVMKKIYRETLLTSQVEQFQTEKKKNVTLRENAMLTNALLADSEEEYRQLMGRIQSIDAGFADKCGRYVSAVCVSENMDRTKEENARLWNFVVTNYLEERLSQRFEVTATADLEKKAFFLISISSDNQRDKVLQELEDGQRQLCKYFNILVFSVVSTICHGVSEIAKSYNEAVCALEGRTSDSKEAVIEYVNKMDEYKKYILPFKKRMTFTASLNSGNPEEVRIALTDIFEDAKENKITLERFRILCVELLALCTDRMVKTSQHTVHEMDWRQSCMFENVHKKRNFTELEEYVQEFCKMISMAKKEEKKPIPENVEKVIRIIEECYADPGLNVDVISKEIYMNYNYLCVVFKKAMNMTINDYIFKYRMQKAIEYFNAGFTQVQDVAEKTGYSNVGYFTRCFRKEFGITPSKYINSLQ